MYNQSGIYFIMAIGCNFLCDNENCEHCGKSIVLTGSWPMVSIDKMIFSLEKDDPFNQLDEFKKLQENERQYICITLPNMYDLEIEAYRIQKWCHRCNLISVFETDPNDLEEVSERSDICMSCEKETLTTFQECVRDNIECPFCKTVMKQERWFVNDQIEDQIEDQGDSNDR